jgi:hypothetical protein
VSTGYIYTHTFLTNKIMSICFPNLLSAVYLVRCEGRDVQDERERREMPAKFWSENPETFFFPIDIEMDILKWVQAK